MHKLTGEIQKIDPLKLSKTEKSYRRIYFNLDDGNFSWTDIVSGYRNAARWKPIIQAGVGTKVGGLQYRSEKDKTIDGDSYPVIIQTNSSKAEEEQNVSTNGALGKMVGTQRWEELRKKLH